MTPPSENLRWLAVSAIVLAAFGVIALVQATGSAARSYGEIVWNLSDPAMEVVTVETAVGLNEALLSSGRRGRIVVYLSRFLHFVPAAGVIPDRHNHFPIPAVDLVAAYEPKTEPRTLLWILLQEGIAREVVHVLPPREYERRRGEIGAPPSGIDLRPEAIVTDELGSRRTILVHPPVLTEPIILGIDAAYLDEAEVGTALDLLRTSGLQSDLVICNFSSENPDVTDDARRRLSLLAAKLEGDG